jgi:HAE1 family hydrophobic/amphiphilic exporter-1
VELGARDYGTLATFNGAPNAILVVYQLPGANLVDVSNRLKGALARLTAPDYPVKVPQGAEAKLFYDSAMFIEASVHEVFKTLIEAFILVFLVVLVFLQSFRTTLIPALTIPVSLIGTLFVMQILGFSINMLTLFGLVLAIGIVVDDAIVVVENVERNITQHGLSPREATIKAMGEITGAVVAITLVLMSVFLPTAALPGISGEMYRQFALTIAASTAISAICALTLSPALCAMILSGHHKEDPTKKKSVIGQLVSAPARIFNTFFDGLTAVYAGFTKLSIRAALVTVLVFGAVTAFTFWSFARVPTGFVPEEDLGFIVVSAQLPDGASLERSKAVIDRVSAAVEKVDGVADVVALSGFSILQGNNANVANCWVVLEPWGDRYARGRGLKAVMADINAAVAPVQDSSFLVFSLPAIQGLGNASGFDMRVQDVSNVGRDVLAQATNETIGKAFTQQGILAAFSGFRPGVPQLFLDIDRERAIKTGVPLQSVFDTLQTALGSSYVNDFNLAGRTFQVSLQADAPFRLRSEDILKLEVRHPNGQMVPLGALASIRETIGPDRVERYNMYQASTINGIPAPGTSSGAALDIMEAIAKESILPAGLSFEWTAMSFQERQLGSQSIIVFALAILLVYLILAAQYESFTMPLAVVLSVPLVILGAVIALNIRGLDNNIFTQVGLVLLVGLGAKNAILIVEFARENLAKGMTPLDAAVDAAKTRFRPIIMTSLAFILGVVPLLGATGAGAGSRQAIGTAVFGGMISNTVLGLLFTPALFYIVVRVVRLFKKDAFTPKQHETPAAQTSAAH